MFEKQHDLSPKAMGSPKTDRASSPDDSVNTDEGLKDEPLLDKDGKKIGFGATLRNRYLLIDQADVLMKKE